MPRIFLCLLLSAPISSFVFADEELFPFVVSYDAPSNATDVSSLLPRPAGGMGFIRADNGHLVNDTGPIRFWATNLCFDACFPSHEQAERLAARLARLGINCVRMHHMDARSIWGNSPNKLTIDPDQMDRLDYLVHQLKLRGIYTNLNLHVSRTLGPKEGFPDPNSRPKYDKGLDNFEPRMIQMQRKYAQDLLTHANPYTRTTYTQEPAIAFVEINNENALFNSWSRQQLDDLPEPHAMTFRTLWNRWLLNKYGSTQSLKAVWNVGSQPLGEELLKNGSFSEWPSSHWKLERDDETVAEWSVATSDESGQALQLKVTNQGRVAWHPQITQSGFSVRKGQAYTLSCRLRADQAQQIGLNCKMAHEPWQNIGLSVRADVQSEWKTFRWTYVATDDDDLVRITLTGFKLGVYQIADVSLRPGGITGLESGLSLENNSVPVLKRGQLKGTDAARKDFVDFMYDTEQHYWSEMYRYLKDDLQVRSLVSGTQLSYSPVTIQSALDYIDAHSYWHHPRFPGRPWDSKDWYVENAALVNSPGGTLASLAARRVAGLPYTVSEYNHPAPIAYAAEGFPMIAAMGAFQGWDGIFSFAYCHNSDFEPRRVGSFFDIKANTVKLVHQPACAAMFLRGDVSQAKTVLTANMSADAERSVLHTAGDPWQLTANQFGVPANSALRHGVAIQRVPKTEQSVAPEANTTSADDDAETVFCSDTDQLLWDASRAEAGYFQVDSPRTKLWTGFVGQRKFQLGDVQLAIGKTRLDWATVSMTCLDGQGFDQPGRVLIAATGWMQNQDTQTESLEKNRITLRNRWGNEPVLCEGISATLTLPVAADRITVYALDERGDRRQELAIEQSLGNAELKLSPEHRTLWYEAVIR